MTTSTAVPGSTRSRIVRAARKASSDAFHPSAAWVMGAAHGQAGGSCHRSTDPAAVFATISHDPGAALGLSDDLPLRLLGAAIRAARAGQSGRATGRERVCHYV